MAAFGLTESYTLLSQAVCLARVRWRYSLLIAFWAKWYSALKQNSFEHGSLRVRFVGSRLSYPSLLLPLLGSVSSIKVGALYET
jgi:hypothetical protein